MGCLDNPFGEYAGNDRLGNSQQKDKLLNLLKQKNKDKIPSNVDAAATKLARGQGKKKC